MKQKAWIINTSFSLVLLIGISFLVGCGSGKIPKSALAMHPQTIENRQLQTRGFQTSDENAIMAASAALLQDLGYSLDESETGLGLISASKKRDASDKKQVAGAIFMALMFGVSSRIDDVQKIRVCVVTRPVRDVINVRVTFQRVVWDNYGHISKLEQIEDIEIYQEFFEKLSKSVFLEANQI
jgi:hypothetical protein